MPEMEFLFDQYRWKILVSRIRVILIGSVSGHLYPDHFEDLLACWKSKVECHAVESVRIPGLDQGANRLVELFIAHNASVGHRATVWNRFRILRPIQKGFIPHSFGSIPSECTSVRLYIHRANQMRCVT